MARPPISRRVFLGAAGAAVTASALSACGGGGFDPLAPGSTELPGDVTDGDPILIPQTVEQIETTHFRDLVGETFYVWHPDSGPGQMTLVNFIDRTESAQVPAELALRDPFTLEFEAIEGTVPASGTITLEHPAVGEHELHLQRLPPDDGFGLYDIHFS